MMSATGATSVVPEDLVSRREALATEVWVIAQVDAVPQVPKPGLLDVS